LEAGWTRRRGERDARGAALVEAAIVLPLIVMITFGAIEFGIGFGQKSGLESAGRAGARKAATLGTDFDNAAKTQLALDTLPAVNAALSSTSVPALVKVWIYKNNSGRVDPESSCATDCVSFTPSAGDPQHFSPLTANGSFPIADVTPCGLDPDKVSVRIKGRFHFLTGLVGRGGVDLTSTATLQFEPTANC